MARLLAALEMAEGRGERAGASWAAGGWAKALQVVGQMVGAEMVVEAAVAAATEVEVGDQVGAVTMAVEPLVVAEQGMVAASREVDMVRALTEMARAVEIQAGGV